MLRKSDILPLVLAAISAALIVGLGYFGVTSIYAAKVGKNQAADNVVTDNSQSKPKLNNDLTADSTTSPAEAFVIPAIVPEGTAVNINGSRKMAQINQALSRGFHRQFPGTAINTDNDGNTQGIDLLTSGLIDLAAIDRPLNDTEKSSGLKAIKISSGITGDSGFKSDELYYVYQEPPTSEAEAFLGFVLSAKGQKAINQLEVPQ
ncbi:MAG: hypothetical protein AAFQ80_15665 [Cyanobacteria bacterium J06621_8]